MYSSEEVNRLIIALILYSGANNNQGLKSIPGECYSNQANTILLALENSMSSADMCNKL